MRRNLHGYEFSDEAEEIYKRYEGRSLYIYGAGLVGKRTLRSILALTDWKVAGFIDRDSRKHHCFEDGVEIFSVADLREEKSGSYLILMGLNDEMDEEVEAMGSTGKFL